MAEKKKFALLSVMNGKQVIEEQPTDILQKLTAIRGSIVHVNQSLSQVDSLLCEVEKVLLDVERIIHLVRECTTSLKVLRETSTALSSVPIVGGCINALSKAIGAVEKALKPLSGVLSKVDNCLSSLKKEIKLFHAGTSETISFTKLAETELPKIVNTLTVLNYLLQIVKVLLPIVEGTDLQQKMDAIREKLDGIENAVRLPIQQFDESLVTVSASLTSIRDWCNELKRKTKGITQIAQAFQSVSNIISPIGNAIKKILNAIAPIRWVLQAVSCLIDKVLTPVVNAILKATGLQHLIDKMEQSIMEKLGISKLLDELTSVIDNSALVKELEKAIDIKSLLSDRFDALCAGLEDFSPTKNIDLREKTKDLLLSLWNSSLDFSKPALIPDWPVEPTFHAVDSRNILRRLPRINWYKADFLCKNASVLTSEEAYHSEEAAHIAAQVSCLCTSFNSLQEECANFKARFALLEEAVSLPEYYQQELQALQECLQFTKHSLDFIINTFTHSSKYVTVLQGIKECIDRLQKDCNSLAENLRELKDKTETYHSAMLAVMQKIPSSGKIDELNMAVKEYASQADILLTSFALAAEHHPDTDVLVQLDDAKRHIEQNASSLLSELEETKGYAEKIIGNVSGLSDSLSSVLKCFQMLSPDGYLLPEEVVHKLDSMATVLKQVEGILDPLHLLIGTLCKKEKAGSSETFTPIVGYKAMLIQFTNHLNSTVESNVQAFERIEVVLPIERLNKQLKSLSESLVCKEEISGNLAENFALLTDFVEKGMSYVIDGQTVINKYLSSDDIDKLKELSKSIVETH